VRCDPLPEVAEGLPAWEDVRFMAHAGGSPAGLLQLEPYSNSREAFEISYANGFRVFEMDLVRLGDGTVVVAHDFHEDRYGLDQRFQDSTRADVEELRWEGVYDLMLGEELLELVAEYPDIWMILDTKYQHLEIERSLIEMAPGADVLDRLVPHLVETDHTEMLAALYEFPHRIVATYKWGGSDTFLLSEMERLGIDDIMMNWEGRWSEEGQALMESAGKRVWVHSPEDPEVIVDFLDRGVNVYSNGWTTCEGP
jgi:glycerophosphoryl diester phosphodiesterase